MLEEDLRSHFVAMRVCGLFRIRSLGQVQASAATAGLRIGIAKQNALLFSYQPGGNDSRVEYTMTLPSAMAENFRVKLSELVVQADGTKGSRLTTPGDLVAAAVGMVTAQTGAVLDAAVAMTEVMAGRSTSIKTGTHEFVLPNGEAVMLDFQCDVAEVPFEPLKRDLEQDLRRYDVGDVILTIKRYADADADAYAKLATRTGIKWCALQSGQKGLGFLYRALPEAMWQRFSLTPHDADDFGIVQFAELVSSTGQVLPFRAQTPERTMVTATKRYYSEIADDPAQAAAFLVAFTKKLMEQKEKVLARSVVMDVFRESVDPDLFHGVIGKVLNRWEDNRWVRRLGEGPSTKFTLNEKCLDLLADDDLLAFARTFFPRRHAGQQEVVTPTVDSLQVIPPEGLPKHAASLNNAPPVILPAVSPDLSPLVKAFGDKLQKLQLVEVRRAELGALVASITELDTQIARLGAQRNALEAQRAQLEQEIAGTPSAEALLEWLQNT